MKYSERVSEYMEDCWEWWAEIFGFIYDYYSEDNWAELRFFIYRSIAVFVLTFCMTVSLLSCVQLK